LATSNKPQSFEVVINWNRTCGTSCQRT